MKNRVACSLYSPGRRHVAVRAAVCPGVGYHHRQAR